MKTLRLLLLSLCLCLFAASCGRQSSLDVQKRGSLIRAANGNIYASECLRKASSTQDVLSCEVDEEGVASRGIASRGVYTYGDTNTGGGYYNPISTFDPFSSQYFGGGQSSNVNYGSSNYYNSYNQGVVWDPTQFQNTQWNNFFNYSSTSVWNNDPYGWYKFLYGNYGSYNNYGGGYNSGYQGSSICSVNWVNLGGYGDSLDPEYLLCGNPWSPDDGYGYYPGYGGYYPSQGQTVFEMKIINPQSGATTSRYYLVGQSSSSRQASYQIWKETAGQVTQYRSINKSKFDNILNLVNRIDSSTTQAEATIAIACSNPERRVLTVQNGSKLISDRMAPCGQAFLNTSPYARRLEQAILQVLPLQ